MRSESNFLVPSRSSTRLPKRYTRGVPAAARGRAYCQGRHRSSCSGAGGVVLAANTAPVIARVQRRPEVLGLVASLAATYPASFWA